MVRIVMPSVWCTDGNTKFQIAAGLLPDVIKRFVDAHPVYRRRLLGPDMEPVGHINICVDDDLIPRRSRATTMVPEGSTVTIIPPMAGG